MRLTTSHLIHTTFSLMMSAVMLTSTGVAADSSEKQSKKNKEYDSRSQYEPHQNDSRKTTQLPSALSELDLKEDQKEKILDHLSKHDKKLHSTWKEFHQKHMQVVEMEAAWAAAVRDTLNEEDQKNFDKKRKADRQMKRKKKQRSNEKYDEQTARYDSDSKKKSDRNQSKADKSANRKKIRDESVRQASAEKREQMKHPGKEKADAVTLMIVTMASPLKYTEGAKQSADQKHQCSEACQKYSSELQSLWKEIHSLHGELVQIEADRMSSIEEVLTKKQLKQLKENRSQPENQTASR